VGLFRVVLVLFGFAIACCGVAFLLTKRRIYLKWAGRLFAGGVVAALVFFGVLLVDRLI
jgi:hypothetical protein